MLLAIVAGILLYDVFFPSLSSIIFIVLGGFISTLVLHKIALKKTLPNLLFTTSTVILFLGVGLLAKEKCQIFTDPLHYIRTQQKNKIDEKTYLFSVNEILKPTRYQNKYVVELKTINDSVHSGKILLNVSKDSLKDRLSVGKWYYARTSLLDVPSPKNPYQFNYGSYLKRKQIYGQLSVETSELLPSKDLESSSPWVWSSRFRESLQKSLHAHNFSKSQLAVINALVLGERSGIDQNMNNQYAAAGMMHILAVSGLHVGIVLLLLRIITKPLAGHKLRWIRSILIISLIWTFAFITGLSPSVLRAATMFSFLEIGHNLGGKRKSIDAVLASALLLIVFDPLIIFQVGFQLSYLAVLGILWIQPWLSNFYRPNFKIDQIIWGVATVTVSAQIGVLPLSLYYFHQFPGLFFVSNIVVLPFLGIILAEGIFIVALAYMDILPDFIASAYGAIIDGLNQFIFWVADKETFLVKNITISLLFLCACYLTIIMLTLLLKKLSLRRCVLASAAIICLTVVIMYEKAHPEKEQLTIFNKSRTTLIGQFDRNRLSLYSNNSLENLITDSRIVSYQNGVTIDSLSAESLGSYFRFKRKELLVVDSLGVYQLKNAKPDFILLSQSPKINLSRLIEKHPEATIIADASNYRSYVERWRETCKKQKIPFHSTYEKGAFIIK